MNEALPTLVFAAGIGQLGVLIASALVPFRLNWKAELKGLSRLHRQMYWVYGGYVVLAIVAFGFISLCNAQEMVKAQAARLIVENELTADGLASEIFSLIDSPAQPGQPRELEQLSSNARSLGKPNAARDIVDLIEQAAGPRLKGRAS